MKTGKGQLQNSVSLLLRAFRHRNFRLFFGGQLISVTGTWMQTIAQYWLVYRLTHSSVALGLIGFSSQIPVFLLAPVGGAVADRYSRHRIVVATQMLAMVQAAILAALTLTGHVRIFHIFVLAFFLGVINSFDMPARQAFVVEMVGKEDLINAIALNSSMFNGARIIGPAVAGVLVSAIGEGWCFFANAVSFLAVIAGLVSMRLEKKTPVPLKGTAWSSIVEGFRYVRHTGTIRSILILLGLVSLIGMPYAVLMPIFADRILHGGVRGLGVLMGATGVGALTGALSLAVRKNVHGLGRIVAFTAGGFGAGLIFFSLSRSFWLSAAFLLPVGFCMMVEMASSNTLIQTMVPDKLRGRVMSVYLMMFMGMAPFGALLAGGAAHLIGAPFTIMVGGVVCIASAVGFYLRLPPFRIKGGPMIVALGLAGGDPADETTGEGSLAFRHKKEIWNRPDP